MNYIWSWNQMFNIFSMFLVGYNGFNTLWLGSNSFDFDPQVSHNSLLEYVRTNMNYVLLQNLSRIPCEDVLLLYTFYTVKVSLSEVKQVLYCLGSKGPPTGKKNSNRNMGKKILEIANGHGEMGLDSWRRLVCGLDDGETCKTENTIPAVKHRGGSIVFSGHLATEGISALHKKDVRGRTVCGHMKISFQDISQVVKTWVQRGLPNRLWLRPYSPV